MRLLWADYRWIFLCKIFWSTAEKLKIINLFLEVYRDMFMKWFIKSFFKKCEYSEVYTNNDFLQSIDWFISSDLLKDFLVTYSYYFLLTTRIFLIKEL